MGSPLCQSASRTASRQVSCPGITMIRSTWQPMSADEVVRARCLWPVCGPAKWSPRSCSTGCA